MHKRTAGILAVGVVAAIAMTSCSSSKKSSGTSSSSSSTSSKPQVGVILPDTTSSARYTTYDAPLLTKAFQAAGIKADVQNAGGDNAKFVSIAQTMISEGVKVLLIDPADPATGISVESAAKAQGIHVIDYDRVNLGGSAEYYVSFDNEAVGKLQGQGLLDCLSTAGKTSGAQVIQLNGGTDIDNNAVLFKKGAHSVLDPAASAGKITIAKEVDVSKWDNSTAATDFQQLLTANNGKVDGVLAANDGIGGAAIGILKQNHLQVPVTGQDATPDGLANILAGDQCMTVWKDVRTEADAAAKLAIALAKGDMSGAAAMAKQTLHDPKGNRDIPSVLLVPEAINKATVKKVIDQGFATAADVCKNVAEACKTAGITS